MLNEIQLYLDLILSYYKIYFYSENQNVLQTPCSSQTYKCQQLDQ